MPLLSLPNELLLHIGKHLNYQHDLYALSLVSRHLHALLNSLLYTRDADFRELNYPALSWAARTGSLPTARKAITAGAYHHNAVYQSTQLCAAAQHGHRAIVQLLLDCATEHPAQQQPFVAIKKPRRGPLRRRPGVSQNPIVYAAQAGHVEIVRLLLAHEPLRTPDIVIVGDYGASPLAAAVGGGHLEVVRVLVEAGAGGMPLELALVARAAAKGYLDIVRFLVHVSKKKADDDDDDDDGSPGPAVRRGGELETAVRCAAENGHLSVLEFLVDEAGADLSPAGCRRVYPLQFAEVLEHREVVDFLFERKAYVDLAGGVDDEEEEEDRVKADRMVVLSALAACGKTDLLRQALSRGWDPNAGLWPGPASALQDKRPLMWAAERGHVEGVKLLLAYGANAGWCSERSIPREEGADWIPETNALDCAIDRAHTDVVAVLIAHGAKPNVRFENEMPSLECAVVPYEPVFQLLLDHGVQMGDRDGAALVGEVIEKGTASQLRFLLDRGVRVEGSLLAEKIAKRDPSIFNTLLEYGYDLEPQGGQHDQDILMATTGEDANLDMLRWLIRWGFEIQRADLSYLVSSAARGGPESEVASQLLDLLLGYSRTPDERDELLDGALLHLVGRKPGYLSGYIAGIRLLLDRGANPLLEDTHRGCLLKLAANAGYLDVLEILFQAICARNAPVEVVKRQVTLAKSHWRARIHPGVLSALERFYWRTVYPVPL